MHVILLFNETPPSDCKKFAVESWEHGLVDGKKVYFASRLWDYLSRKKFRFDLYPRGLRIVRCSRGMEKPSKERVTLEEVLALTDGKIPAKAWSGRVNNIQSSKFEYDF
jgi:hypothetical protein